MPRPGPPKLAGGAEARALSDALHAHPRAADEIPRERDPQAVRVVGDAHARMLVEDAGQVARAGTGHSGEFLQCPASPRLGRDGVLNPVDGRMQVVAPLQPGRHLRVRSRTPQVHHQEARDGDSDGRTGQLGDKVQRQVDPGCDAGAGPSFPAGNIQAVLQHPARLAPGPRARHSNHGASCTRSHRAALRGQRAGRPSRSIPAGARAGSRPGASGRSPPRHRPAPAMPGYRPGRLARSHRLTRRPPRRRPGDPEAGGCQPGEARPTLSPPMQGRHSAARTVPGHSPGWRGAAPRPAPLCRAGAPAVGRR